MKILDKTHDFSFALFLARKYREKYGDEASGTYIWVEEKYFRGETWFCIMYNHV